MKKDQKYLEDLLIIVPIRRSGLRSNMDTDELIVPDAKNKHSLMSLLVHIAAPKLCNNLPSHPRSVNSTELFKQNFKTHLFEEYLY